MRAAPEEVYMMMEERLRPRWKEYLKEGLKEGQNQVLALLEQGYTLEQVKAALARSAARNSP
jgi:SOS response regulatory protein OraA/RecX